MSRCGKLLIAVFLVLLISLILQPGMALAQDEESRIELFLSHTEYDTEVTPGEESVIYVKVLNKGDAPATDIRLSAQPPKGWDVDIRPSVIDYLGADSEKTLDILVTPDKYADRGSHRIRIVAETDETEDTITIYVRVDTATTIWTWIGAGIACIVVGCFVFIFIRSGRKQA